MKTVMVQGVTDPVDAYCEWFKSNVILTPERTCPYIHIYCCQNTVWLLNPKLKDRLYDSSLRSLR